MRIVEQNIIAKRREKIEEKEWDTDRDKKNEGCLMC